VSRVGAGSVTLAGGVEMPLLGLGLWQVPAGDQAERAVGWALESGYRHVDTAQAYRNESSVGRALAAAGVSRDQVFLTTKFYPEHSDPVAEAERSLERLGIEKLDLYLVHWPQSGPTWAWAGMERTLERGLTRAIGVSNFDAGELERLLAIASHPPAVNQIQLSPFQYRRRLVKACARLGIAPEAYSPLTTGRDLADPTVAAIADRLGRTPAQVLLRWGVQRGFAVIPKSIHRERIVENSRIFDFELGEDDLGTLDALDRTDGTDRAHERPWWTTEPRRGDFTRRLARRLQR
jgi:diketogulonate reductase-like aldo/keto reductase